MMLWTIARHTIAEGIRMKLALVFLVLIGLVVLGLPFSIAGDASLTGAVQSFMSYGLAATSILLALLTIFMSRSLADDLVRRQIFLVITKPIARWQYIVGKWLGISLLNFIFLTCSAATIYAMVHYIKWTHPPIDDRYDEDSLVNEVLVARHGLKCLPPDFTKPARVEFQRNLEQGLYDDVPKFDRDRELKRLALTHEARWRFVGPQSMRVFEFENVLCDRSPDKKIQLRFRTDVTGYPSDEIFRSLWRVGDPTKGTPAYEIRVRHMVGRYHSIPVPADAVASDNTLTVYFFNRNPYKGEPQFNNVIEFKRSNELTVLFAVGSFEWNFVRLLILIQCKLLFLGAVSLLMVTVFSYPVACLGSFTVYILAGCRAFILDALDLASDDYASLFSSFKEFFVQSFTYLYNVILWIIPDFAKYDAVENFVNGQNVSLVWVLNAIFWLVLIKTVIVLGLAVLFFHRREVAELSF